MTSARSDQLYAKWEEIEEHTYQEILAFLQANEWGAAERIAKGITGDIMRHVDGYDAREIASHVAT